MVSGKLATRTLATAFALVASALAVACGGADDMFAGMGQGGVTTSPVGDGGVADAGPLTATDKAKDLFAKLEPQLSATCGTCHDTGVAGAPKFLTKPDVYGSVKAYKGIVLKDYMNSRLLVVGPETGHTGGPGLQGELKQACTTWLQTEAAALQEVVLPGTDPFTVTVGANAVDLSKAGTGLAGARLTFNATFSGQLLSMGTLQVVAPAGLGLQVTHPIFVVIQPNGDEVEDAVDSFSNVDQAVPAGQTVTLGPGTLVLNKVPQGARMRIRFTSIKTVVPTDAGAAGGCRSLATFVSSAKPQLQQCLGCHGQNGPQRGAMDLTGLQTNDDAAACAQALNKINLTNKPASILLSRPKQGSGHPFAVPNAGTYDAAINGWIANE